MATGVHFLDVVGGAIVALTGAGLVDRGTAWRSPVGCAIIEGMNSTGDIDATGSDERDPDDRGREEAPVADDERVVDGTALPVDEEDDVPVPLDADIEVPTDDAIEQHRTVRIDDDHDQV